MKIGLTGSIACGKSTVAAMLREAGVPVVDADAISRALTAPGGAALPALREAFGDGIFDADALNRRALGELVFSDAAQRARLNAILHPLIIRQTFDELSALSRAHSPVFADVPLLYECGMEGGFDRVWVVAAPRAVALSRLMARDHLSEAEAARRIDAQMPLGEKLRRADAVIRTDRSLPAVRAQVARLLAAIPQSNV